MFSREFLKFLLLPLVEMLRLHVNLLLMFGLGKKFSQGILDCMLLSLFSVENNVIENVSFVENALQIFEKKEGVYLKPKIKFRFAMKNSSAYISFYCGRNEMKLLLF